MIEEVDVGKFCPLLFVSFSNLIKNLFCAWYIYDTSHLEYFHFPFFVFIWILVEHDASANTVHRYLKHFVRHNSWGPEYGDLRQHFIRKKIWIHEMGYVWKIIFIERALPLGKNCFFKGSSFMYPNWKNRLRSICPT